MDGDAPPRPLPLLEGSSGETCSLPGDELRERLASFARIGEDNLLESRAEGERRVLVFRADAELRRSLERIIAAERECCSFLDLTIREEPGTAKEPGRLVVTVAAPPESALVAAGFAAAFGAT
jgi:hypothetical protein